MSDPKTAEKFTDEERAAMKERAQELSGAKRKGAGKADDESAVLAKIAEMPDADRVLAERVHAVVTAEAPELSPKTWYGMPGDRRRGEGDRRVGQASRELSAQPPGRSGHSRDSVA